MNVIADTEMLAYMILDVTYQREANYGQSLGWIAHELKDAGGLELTEDQLDMDCAQCGAVAFIDADDRTAHHQSGEDEDGIDHEADAGHLPSFADDMFPSRKWAGTITRAEWDALRSAWSLEEDGSTPNGGMLTEYGWMPACAFDFDGMDWNAGGETPILYASLYVNVPPGWWEEPA